MNNTSTIQLIEELHRIWNSGDISAIPNVYSEDFIVHWPKSWGDKSRGHEGIRQSIVHSRETFPDWHEEVLDLIVSGDRAVTRYRSTGTQQKSYLGIEATGKKVEFEEISIFRIEQNRVIEQWCLGDDLHCIRQLQA